MARAETSTELTKLRSSQRSILYMTIHVPRTVYTARVNDPSLILAAMDPVTAVTYDTGSGTLANVMPGMTLYVGSAAGLCDLGMVRIKNTPSATLFYIGETSDIAWSNNLYLTVVEEYELWQKHVFTSNDIAFMDYDVAYTDQHSELDPVPVMGADVVLELVGASVTLVRSWTSSWVLGSTISSYACTVTGPAGASVDNATSATPTFTFTAPGWYTLNLTVTAANGKTTTGHRLVYVHSEASPPITDFDVVTPPAGSADDGGWGFTIKMYGEAATVRERAKVILFSKDWYGSDAGSIGPVPGSENILACGWISREAINWNPEDNSVDFEVKGPHYWLDQETNYPVYVEYNASPTVWTMLKDLTVDRALWHLLHWRSTVTTCLDITLTGDTNLIVGMDIPIGSIFEQLKAMAKETILANVLFNRYGQLYIEIDTQYVPDASRSTIPVVMALTGDDFGETISIERQTTKKASNVRANAVFFDGTVFMPMGSNFPGESIGSTGKQVSFDRLISASQDDLNILAGLLYARENNGYPVVDITLVSNNRFIDICPRQRVTMTVTLSDTVRGIVWTDKKFIPRQINMDVNEGYITTTLELEGETTNTIPGRTIVPPQIVTENINTDYGSEPISFPLFPLPNISFPPYLPETPTAVNCTLYAKVYSLSPNKSSVKTSETESERVADFYYPCEIRSTGLRTYVELFGTFQQMIGGVWTTIQADDNSWYSMEAVDINGSVIAYSIVSSVSWRQKNFYFASGGYKDIYGFRLRVIAPGPTAGICYANRIISVATDYGTWSNTGNILGAPDGNKASLCISSNLGSGQIFVGFAYSFPAGGTIQTYGVSGNNEATYRLRAYLNDTNVVMNNSESLVTSLSFNQVMYAMDPNNGSCAYIDAISVTPAASNNYRIILEGANLWNVCPVGSNV